MLLKHATMLLAAVTLVAGCAKQPLPKCSKDIHVLASAPGDELTPSDCPSLRTRAVLYIEVLADGSAGHIRAALSDIQPGPAGSCKNPQTSVESLADRVFGKARFTPPGNRCEKQIAFDVNEDPPAP